MKNTFRRLIAMAAAVLATLCLTAVFAQEGGSTPSEPLTGMANPWTEMESLEALNEALDMNLQLPGVMGVTDECYLLMTTEEMMIGEVQFKVNGTQYILRGAPTFDEDISGVYLENGETAFAGKEPSDCEILIADNMKLARWCDINGQYVLVVEDSEMDEETFEAIVDEMMAVTNPFQPVALKDGTYYDTVSQRAYAQVTALGNDAYAIEIHWADSASEDNVWTMTGQVTEDGLLNYTDCVRRHIVAAGDGTETETEKVELPDGYFELEENTLYWTGADQENLQAMIFVAEAN